MNIENLSQDRSSRAVDNSVSNSLEKFNLERTRHIQKLKGILRQDTRIVVDEHIPARIPRTIDQLDHMDLRRKLMSNGSLSFGRDTTLRISVNEPAGLTLIDEDTAARIIEEHSRFIKEMSPIIRSRGLISFPKESHYITYAEREAQKQEAIAKQREWTERRSEEVEPFLQLAQKRGLQLDLNCMSGKPVFADKDHIPGDIPSSFFVIEGAELKEYKINFITNSREDFISTIRSILVYMEHGAFEKDSNEFILYGTIEVKDLINFLGGKDTNKDGLDSED